MRPVGRIGLTGGIGSGKSTVAGLLAQLGARVVDTDAIARSLTAAGGAGMAPIRHAFGAAMLAPDGSLDRERMRERAFADPGARTRLEAILHPLIGAEAERQAAAASGQAVVFDVPLLTESASWRSRVDRVLVVDCPAAVQVERVIRRSGWTAQAVRAVIASQADPGRRRAIADAVIDNGAACSMADLQRSVQQLGQAWQV